MKKIILDFPKQFKTGLMAAEKIKKPGVFEKIIVCAMGGSALPADLARMFVKTPITVHRNYNLPSSANKKSLIICISYSGNTEETLSAFKRAVAKKLPLIAICSGGKLEAMSRKNNIPFAKVPKGFQPRMALGFQFSALIKILINCRMASDIEPKLLMLQKKLNPGLLEKPAKKLAAKLKGKLPIIYSSADYWALARIWKIKFNENSKIPAFSNYFPELNHNEMAGFGEMTNIKGLSEIIHVLILREETENPKTLKRMKLTAELLNKKKIKTDFVLLKGKEKLSKIFSNILLSDWVSYFLAVENKVDPLALKMVEDFKKKMEKKQ